MTSSALPATRLLFRGVGYLSLLLILTATAIMILCLSTSRARPQSGIYRGERLLEALMGRPLAAAGDGQAQPTLTVTAIRIMCFTMTIRVRQQSGISITMFT